MHAFPYQQYPPPAPPGPPPQLYFLPAPPKRSVKPGLVVIAVLSVLVLVAALIAGLAGGGGSHYSPTMHGTPDENAGLWVYQEADGLCLPAAMAELMAAHQGRSSAGALLPQIVSRAVAGGYLESDGDGYSGMTMSEAVSFLTYNGVPVSLSYASLSELETVLDSGRLAIVSVDSDELPAWGETDSLDGTSYDSGANHAVVVTGVDTGTGTVYLNDSGLPGGREERLTVTEFTDAWADGNYQMIAT
jgi:hypothetical protein